MKLPLVSFLVPFLALLYTATAKSPPRHERSVTQQVVYTTSNTDECKLLNILLPYVTMLEAVLEQYFKTDTDAAILFKLLGTLGRHVIVRNDAAEVRPALVKESVSFMREYEKFAHWLSENYKDNSLLPIAGIMDTIFAARFGKRLKIIESEMKKLDQEDSWNELMRFWNTVNATDTEKLFAMSAPQLKSLDKFLDRTKTMAMEHKSFELLYQTHVLEALTDLARSMTTRRDRNKSAAESAGKQSTTPAANSKEATSKPEATTTGAPDGTDEALKVRSARDEESAKKKDNEKKDAKSKESSSNDSLKSNASDRSAMKEEETIKGESKKPGPNKRSSGGGNKKNSDGGNKKNKKQKNSRNKNDSKAKRGGKDEDEGGKKSKKKL